MLSPHIGGVPLQKECDESEVAITELIYPTEFYYRYAVEPGYIAKPALNLMDVRVGSPCFLCGRKDFTTGIRKEDAVKANFTDYDYCRMQGKHVCIFCASTVTDAGRKTGKYCIGRTAVLLGSNVDIGELIGTPLLMG